MKNLFFKHKIQNHIMMSGKKKTAEKLILKSLKLLQKTIPKNVRTVLKYSVTNSSPTIYIKSIERNRRNNLEFPFLLNKNKRLFYGIKSIVFFSNKKLKYSETFFESFNSEILNSSKKVGRSAQKKLDTHKEAFLKKKFSNYRWF